LDTTQKRGHGVATALAFLALAGCSDDGPMDPARGDSTLTGAVAFVKTGAGVPDLVVALLQGGHVVRTTHTLADGSFAFTGVGEGAYTARLTGLELADVNLRATAFDPLERPVTLGSEPVDLAFAAVGLVPPRVAGDVLCGGVPVAGVTLRVIGGEETDVTVTSDVAGRYAATNLSEGVYAVIPLQAPCALSPTFQAVTVGKGQGGEADFSG
jgi:hypothetical protein